TGGIASIAQTWDPFSHALTTTAAMSAQVLERAQSSTVVMQDASVLLAGGLTRASGAKSSVNTTAVQRFGLARDGSFGYYPFPEFNGAASFTYVVCDNGSTLGVADARCSTGTVNLTVNPV